MKRLLPVLIWIVYALLLGFVSFSSAAIWWVVGIILAALLFLFDRMLYVWWLKPYEQLSIQVQYWWKKRDYWAALRLMCERKQEQSKLILRSIVFVLIWPLLALYIITSTGSVSAIGLIMGLGLGLTIDILSDWHDYRHLRQWLCWQIKRDVNEREVRFVSGLFICLFTAFTVSLLAR